MDKKIKHLEMIQGIIDRMGGNLFLLKGWSITLIVALFAIIAKEINNIYILFSFCILFIFWILDGYFLSMERCFRGLYDEVRLKNDDTVDFSMNIINYKKGKNTWIKSIFSKTLFIFYGTILILMIVATLMFNVKSIKFDVGIDWQNGTCSTTTRSGINK